MAEHQGRERRALNMKYKCVHNNNNNKKKKKKKKEKKKIATKMNV
jgi:hypothetical protein